MVFDMDWTYTKEQLGIPEEKAHPDPKSVTYYIGPDGTFLNPKVEDETSDWGYLMELTIVVYK
jgi:hypothetical protein